MDPHEEELAKVFGAALKKHRQAHGWSQAVFAEKVGVSTNYVSLLECGDRLPALPLLVTIAQALGASTDEMLGRASKSTEWIDDATALLQGIPFRAQPWVLAMLRGVAREAKRLLVEQAQLLTLLWRRLPREEVELTRSLFPCGLDNSGR